MRLDPASTLLKLVLLTVLVLRLFVTPDPRIMSALMLWTSFNTLRKGHVDSRKIFFLTGERSDAAVVGSGNKAMGKSSLLTF